MTIYPLEDLPARLVAKIKIDGWGHWIWTGFIGQDGYGRTSHELAFGQRYRSNGKKCGGRVMSSHRVVYELFKGRILEGLQIDHRCEVKLCCNPDHLQAVTRSVNILRAIHGQDYIPAVTATQLSLDDILKQPQQIELL